MTFLSLQLVEINKIIGGLYPGGIVCVPGCHVTSRNQGLSSNDQGRQRRETLGTRLMLCVVAFSRCRCLSPRPLAMLTKKFYSFLFSTHLPTTSILRYHHPPSWIACCTKTRLDVHVILTFVVNMAESLSLAAWSKSLKNIPYFDSSFIEK